MFDAFFNLKGLGVSIILGMVIGSAGAYKLAGAAQAKKDKKIAEQALDAERQSHEETIALMNVKDELVIVLSQQNKQSFSRNRPSKSQQFLLFLKSLPRGWRSARHPVHG